MKQISSGDLLSQADGHSWNLRESGPFMHMQILCKEISHGVFMLVADTFQMYRYIAQHSTMFVIILVAVWQNE